MGTQAITLASTASFGNPLWRTGTTVPLTNAQIVTNIITSTPVYKISTTQSAEMLLPLTATSVTGFITSLQLTITTAIQSGTPNLPTLVSLGVLINGTYQYTQSQPLTIGAVNNLTFGTKPDGTAWTAADITNTVIKIIDQSSSGLGSLASLSANAIYTSIPVVTITPITTITSSTPQVTWTYTDSDLALQSGYQVQVINLTTNAPIYDSGFITGPDTAYTIPANPLVANNTNATANFNPVSGTSGVGWNAVATSSDGTKVYAAGSTGLYVSNNSGASFSLVSGTNSYSWGGIACSSDGTKVYAMPNNGSNSVYVSTNSGASFVAVATSYFSGNTTTNPVVCSSDGSKVYVGGNQIVYSSNFGLTWSLSTVSGGLGKLYSLACSSDGTKVYASCVSFSAVGYFLISTNSGATFAISGSAPTFDFINSMATSSDGTKVYITGESPTSSSNLGPNNVINATAVQSNGSIVVGGTFTQWNFGSTIGRLARISNAGTLDSTFATNIGTGANGTVTAIAIQPADQKILVAGYFTSFNGTTTGRLVRLNTDGTIDTTFVTNNGTGANALINSIVIQADGKIVIGGAFTSFNGTSINRVARLSSAGVFDTAFATSVSTAANDVVTCVVIQPSDQRILVGGYFTSFNGTTAYGVFRLNTDGTTDTGFTPSLSGVVFVVNAIAVQPSDNKIIIGGLFYTPFSTYTTNALRLSTSGAIDTTFEANIGSNVNNAINSIVVQPADGKIVLVGGYTSFNSSYNYPFVRLNTDGTIDTAFQTKINGSVSTPFNAPQEVLSVVIQSDGRLILAGNFTGYNGSTNTSDNYIIRIDSDGTRDLTFLSRIALWVSTNSGSTFTVTSSTSGIPFDAVTCSTDGINVYATSYDSSGTSNAGVYISTNSGGIFTPISGSTGIAWSAIACTSNAGTVYAVANVGSVYTLVNLPQYKYQVRVAKNLNGVNNFTSYSSFTPTSTSFNDTVPTVVATLQANKPTLVISLPDVTGLGYATRSVAVLRQWSNGYGIIRNGTISNVGLTASTISINDLEAPTGVTVSYQVKALYFDSSGKEYVGSPASVSIAVPNVSKWTIQKCDGLDVGLSVNALLSGSLNISRVRPQSHQYALGSRYPITTSGTVQGYNGEMTIYFDNQPAFITFLPYLDYIGKLLVTAPNGAYKYITLDKNDVTKAMGRGSDLLRELKLAYTEEDSGLGFNEPTLYEF